MSLFEQLEVFLRLSILIGQLLFVIIESETRLRLMLMVILVVLYLEPRLAFRLSLSLVHS